jgi:hypothetical protein
MAPGARRGPKGAEIRPKIRGRIYHFIIPKVCPIKFEVVVCRFVGTVPDILGWDWPNFRPQSGSKSKISSRILHSSRSGASTSGLRPALGRPEDRF